MCQVSRDPRVQRRQPGASTLTRLEAEAFAGNCYFLQLNSSWERSKGEAELSNSQLFEFPPLSVLLYFRRKEIGRSGALGSELVFRWILLSEESVGEVWRQRMNNLRRGANHKEGDVVLLPLHWGFLRPARYFTQECIGKLIRT